MESYRLEKQGIVRSKKPKRKGHKAQRILALKQLNLVIQVATGDYTVVHRMCHRRMRQCMRHYARERDVLAFMKTIAEAHGIVQM